MIRTLLLSFTFAALAFSLLGCSTAPSSAEDRQALVRRAEETVQRFREADPSMNEFFDNSVGYAVFPTVGKGGVGVGGAYGKGVRYEGGELAGYCDLSQGSIGFQLGGQSYAEIIFFQNQSNIEEFKSGTVEFSAQVSAVAATAGASANADYENGVAVFTMTNAGLMYEASVGGQGFDFTPASKFDE